MADDKYSSIGIAKIVELLKERNAAEKRALDAFTRERADRNACAALGWMQGHAGLLRGLPEYAAVLKQVQEACEDAMHQLDSNLREAFSAAELELSGQWPLYFINKLLPMEIEESARSIMIDGNRLPALDLEMAVQSAKNLLSELQFNEKQLLEFLSLLYKSYETLATVQTPSVGIWEIYRALIISQQPSKLWRNGSARNFRPLPELKFRAFLTQLLMNNLTSVSGRQLRLLPPLQQKDSVYIYQPAENRFSHVGRIEFKGIG